MQVFSNERVIQQGEEWCLDILVSQSEHEYVPFVVGKRRNPMWAITVAATKFEKNERYAVTWWLDIDLPLFYQTVPQDLGEVPEGSSPPIPMADEDLVALYRYTKAQDPVDTALGHKKYYYAYKKDGEIVLGYECRIVMSFTSDITSKWNSQNYMYQITLLDTASMVDSIKAAYETYGDNLDWPQAWITPDNIAWETPEPSADESQEDYEARVAEEWAGIERQWITDNKRELFLFLKRRAPGWFQPDIDVDSPVGLISAPQVILPPTKLQVNSNLRRII